MSNKLIMLALLLLATQFTQAQVKKQYQDDTFGQTTVVVKDDQATDNDILSQFDLDDYGMDQVIKITTEQELPAALKTSIPEQPKAEEAVAVVQKKTPKSTVIIDNDAPKRWIPKTKPRKKVAKVAKKPSPEKKEVATNVGGYTKSNSGAKSARKSRVSSGKKKKSYKKSSKRKNRRIKKKKRRKSRKRYSCYSF